MSRLSPSAHNVTVTIMVQDKYLSSVARGATATFTKSQKNGRIYVTIHTIHGGVSKRIGTSHWKDDGVMRQVELRYKSSTYSLPKTGHAQHEESKSETTRVRSTTGMFKQVPFDDAPAPLQVPVQAPVLQTPPSRPTVTPRAPARVAGKRRVRFGPLPPQYISPIFRSKRLFRKPTAEMRSRIHWIGQVHPSRLHLHRQWIRDTYRLISRRSGPSCAAAMLYRIHGKARIDQIID
jgi:hypothetical protein